MKFKEPLKKAHLIQRYKRFFVDIQHKNEVFTSHLANTGSLRGVFEEGLPCLLTKSSNPKRKLPLSLQMIKHPTSWVGVNTLLANEIVFEAWQLGLIPHLKKYKYAQREFAITSETRIDIVLSRKITSKITPQLIQSLKPEERKNFLFLEIKNVTLAEKNKALFPDSPTLRGQKHLKELTRLKKKGFQTEIFFLVQRSDCQKFSPEKNVDPVYYDLLKKAHKTDVKISSYGCLLNEKGISLNHENKIKIIL